MKKKILCSATAFLITLLCLPLGVGAADPDQGEALYLKYCSSCHGKDGRGKGPVSPYLKIKVADLTLLRKNNKGIYPFARVMSSIDGSRAVGPH